MVILFDRVEKDKKKSSQRDRHIKRRRTKEKRKRHKDDEKNVQLSGENPRRFSFIK
jgi:hypothetical protein